MWCFNEKRLFNKVDAHLDELELNEEYMLEDADIMIIVVSVSLGVTEAINRLEKKGIKVGMFRPLYYLVKVSKKELMN